MAESLTGSLVTAWNPSPTYTDEYVWRLSQSSDLPLSVVPETRWPGWWCKMGLFDPMVCGDFLYCDLDTIITGDLSDLASAGVTMMLRDFFFPQRAASGVMFLTEADRAMVWERWIASPEQWMKQYAGIRGGGDGAFIADTIKPTRFLQDEFPGQIASFKVDCQGRPPSDARMICYHGNPRPHVTNWATGGAARWAKSVPSSALRCPR